MTNHDIFKDTAKEKQLLEKISPKFSAETLDINEILSISDDPKAIAALLFKLVQEREKTNKLLEGINDKYDKIMFELKTEGMQKESTEEKKMKFEVLPEQDQIILEFIEKQGGGSASDVQAIMHYRGLNAASQRLNKLYKEGFLKKVQAGRKVLYLAKS